MAGGRDFADELRAIRDEYARRAVAPQCAGQYTLLSPTHAALVFEREQEILRALARHLRVDLNEAEVLDVGSGGGLSLALLAVYGANAARLHGVDVMPDRIALGREQFPAFDLRVIEGDTLPFADASFDLVQQVTVLSSVHSPDLRARLAAEMTRVLRPGGLLLSFDVAGVPLLPRLLNRGLASLSRPRPRTAAAPGAEDVRLTPVLPLRPSELDGLFPELRPLELRLLSPYRPLVERVERSRLAVALLSALPGVRTAALYAARKPER